MSATRCTACTALALAVALAAGPARAEPEDPERPPLSERSVKLFDLSRSTHPIVLDLGPIWARQATDRPPGSEALGAERRTGEIALGLGVTTPTKAFFIGGLQRTLLRVFDGRSFSWTLLLQELRAGLRLGPFEPEARVGIGLVTLDVLRGDWSAQLLTPRVSAGVGFRLGKFRVDIKGHSEYLWRWFGPDYLIRGLTLGVQLDRPPPRGPFKEQTD